LGTPGSFTNETDRHDITEILLKVALNTINQTNLNMIIIELKFCFSKLGSKNHTITKFFSLLTALLDN